MKLRFARRRPSRPSPRKILWPAGRRVCFDPGVAAKVYFVTGTDTGVGKTVFTASLARQLRLRGANVAALKPICSGEREDAEAIQIALGGTLRLNEINPWYFPEPLAPTLAARLEGRRLLKVDVLKHLRRFIRRYDVVLIEGAGGLLSPLGEGFDSRDLINALRAVPVIVCPNRLGAVNQARLVIEALSDGARQRAQIILASARRPDEAAKDNAALLAEHFPAARIHLLPWLGRRWNTATAGRRAPVFPNVTR